MAIVQETFDVPADIMTKLPTGEYHRIRCCKGAVR